MRDSLLDTLAPVFFAAGLLALVAGYAFFAGKHELFPYRLVSGAEDSARGVWEAYIRPPPVDRPARPGTPPGGGAVVHDAARMAPGVTFVTAYGPEGFGGYILDRDGRKLHEWRARLSEVFGRAPHLMWQARDQVVAWHGAHLFPNGDVLFNFQDWSFPFGSGLVKLDKDSKVVWKLARNTHHDVTVEADGTIWVPAHNYRPDGLPGWEAYLRPWFYEDTVLKVSPEGEVLDEISVLEAFRGRLGPMTASYDGPVETRSGQDPIHLNSVKVLPEAWAGRFPQFGAGDLLVSLRNINTVAVIDRGTRQVKWTMVGSFVRQHDAEYLPNGNIMVYDNVGGDPRCGGTRILEIEPVSQAVVWRYDGCGGTPFHSDTRGMQQPLPNGGVLTIEPHGGRILEVARDGSLVWEYHNVIAGGGAPRVGVVTQAERFPEEALPFLAGLPRP